MTQLELPPISFARYLDLLKRRRWTVLPVSLAGLMIGGLIAFFIPRYYVCQTVMKFEGSVLGTGRGKDPMKRIVAAAQISIGYAVEDAVAKLGWPEATTGSPNDRRAFIAEVRKRVKVADIGPGSPGRETANVKITYLDVDGRRAVELANTLREVWIEGQVKKLQDKANRELADVQRRIQIAMETLGNAQQEVVLFERNNGINPEDFQGLRSQLTSVRTRAKEREEELIADLAVRRQRLQASIKATQAKLDKTPATLVTTRLETAPKKLQERLAGALAVLAQMQDAIGRLTPSHPKYEKMAGQIKAVELDVEEMNASLGVDEQIVQPNPKYESLREELEKDVSELALLEGELKDRRQRVTALRAEIKQMPGLMARYAGLKRDVANADAELEAFRRENRAKEQNRRALTESEPYQLLEEARPAPRPTEPNITLVALAGSALGLALAIGLILLLDLVQTTFKTLADVERLLPLPVLGGMSHMVTSEQRRDATVRRTRVGLVAGAFLMLMITVITIYYVAPTRLPPMVRDILALIIGSDAPR